MEELMDALMGILATISPLVFFGIIIFLIVKAVKKKKAKKEADEAQQIRQLEQKRLIEIEEKKRKDEWERKKQISDLAEFYKNKDLVIKLANECVVSFLMHINDPKYRNEKERDVSLTWRIRADYGRDHKTYTEIVYDYYYDKGSKYDCYDDEGNYSPIGSSSESFSFIKANLLPLQDKREAEAFLRAVILNMFDILREKYPKDKNGLDYFIETKMEESRVYDYPPTIWFYLTYTVSNSNYVPPQQW